VSPRVEFEHEADAEYRFAGRWYEERREGLGMAFFDAVEATIDRIVAMPRAVIWCRACRPTYRSDAVR